VRIVIDHLPRAPARLALALALLAGCGGDEAGAPSPPVMSIAKAAPNSGDQQVGIAGTALPEDLRVVVTRGAEPAEGVVVTWTTVGGSLEPALAPTDADGVSRTRWTLALRYETQGATASIQAEAATATVGFLATGSPDPAARNTVHVLSEGNRFEPAELTIIEGDSVNWYWPAGSAGHNVVPDDGDRPAYSGAPDGYPRSHTYRFARPGVYRYYCQTHGGFGGVGMAGTITVQSLPELRSPDRSRARSE
jgi:plastocyanin